MPNVYSRRHPDEIPPGAVYVGRPTIFGNPFALANYSGDREKVIALYREWIMLPAQSDLRLEMRIMLRDKDLVCWCHPLPCHAKMILEIANAKRGEK